MIPRRLRYVDLVARGIVNNRTCLNNWIRDLGFPSGQQTGPNTRTWSEAEVEYWLANRPRGRKLTPPAKGRGRPRKDKSLTSYPGM
jgi:hypothetical protein